MQTIETSPQRAEDVLVEMARHLPHDVPIGRPLVVTGRTASGVPASGEATESVLTAEALWTLQPGGVERLAVLPDGRAEVTRWCDGAEIERSVTPSR